MVGLGAEGDRIHDRGKRLTLGTVGKTTEAARAVRSVHQSSRAEVLAAVCGLTKNDQVRGRF